MWVTTSQTVDLFKLFVYFVLFIFLTHILSHRLKGLNSPLTWGYTVFPQIKGLVTTTTYNYMKTPVRFPLFNFQNIHLLKIKTCKVLLQREG